TALVLGDIAQDQRVSQALALGARGYLLREAAAQEIAAAIRAAQRGSIVLHPQLAANLWQALARANETEREMNSEGGGSSSSRSAPASSTCCVS
ncbi:MAG: hypothetical protein L0Y55_08220, partial [Anaerolineales bacterium]|nr:hypothetical protein [Anaerolineales bacterium]